MRRLAYIIRLHRRDVQGLLDHLEDEKLMTEKQYRFHRNCYVFIIVCGLLWIAVTLWR